MKRWQLFGAGILGTLVGLAGWRFASRRRLLPCPHWLSVLLENPYFNAVASAETILDRLGVAPGMKVVDVGCGPGRVTVPAARRVGPTGSVTALDIQPEMLRRLQEKVEAAGLSNVLPVQAGAGTGALETGAFDAALLVTVLGEIPDQKAALREIFGALRPGGVLSVTEVLPDPHYQLRSHVRSLAIEAGFEEKRSFSDGVAYTLHFARPTR